MYSDITFALFLVQIFPWHKQELLKSLALNEKQNFHYNDDVKYFTYCYKLSQIMSKSVLLFHCGKPRLLKAKPCQVPSS